MDRDETAKVVRTILQVMQQIAGRTRTPADDLFVGILKANQDKLVQAVHTLVSDAEQPPSTERTTAVLASVGIKA